MLNGNTTQHTFFASILFTLAIGACSSPKEKSVDQSASPVPEGASVCEGTRPQVCTMIYQPVCAFDQTGASKTAASACSACANPEVIGFKEGECGQ